MLVINKMSPRCVQRQRYRKGAGCRSLLPDLPPSTKLSDPRATIAVVRTKAEEDTAVFGYEGSPATLSAEPPDNVVQEMR